MRKFLLSVLFLSALLSTSAGAQVKPATPWSANWPAATSTGVVGGAGYYLNLDNILAGGGPPTSYSIDVYITGTVPSVCTFEVQSSPDGVAWNTGTNSLTGDVSCGSTAIGASNVLTYSVAFKPDSNIRINIGTLTGADGTTRVLFFYRRGRNAQ